MSYFDLLLDITTYSLSFLTGNELEIILESVKYFDKYKNLFSFWKSLCQKRFPFIPLNQVLSSHAEIRKYGDVRLSKNFYLMFMESEEKFFYENEKEEWHDNHILRCCKYSLDDQLLHYCKIGLISEVINYGIYHLVVNDNFSLIEMLKLLVKQEENKPEEDNYTWISKMEILIDNKLNPFFLDELVKRCGPEARACRYINLSRVIKNKFYLIIEMLNHHLITIHNSISIIHGIDAQYFSTIKDITWIKELPTGVQTKNHILTMVIKWKLIGIDNYDVESEISDQRMNLIDESLSLGNCDYNQLLRVAARKGSLKLVKKFISLGAIDFGDGYIFALESGSWETIKFFLDLGVSPMFSFSNGHGPLTLVVKNYDLDVIKNLISYGCDDFPSALDKALEFYCDCHYCFKSITELNKLKILGIIEYLLPLAKLNSNDILNQVRNEVMRHKRCKEWGKRWKEYYEISDLINDYKQV